MEPISSHQTLTHLLVKVAQISTHIREAALKSTAQFLSREA